MSEEIKQETLSLETSESEKLSENEIESDTLSTSEIQPKEIVESESESQAKETVTEEEKLSVILKDGTDISDIAFMNGKFLLVSYEKKKKASEYYSGITINGTTYDEVVAFKVTLEKEGEYYAINYHLDDEEE